MKEPVNATHNTSLKYDRRIPGEQLSNFVSVFWNLENNGDKGIVVTLLPDGYFDVLFTSVNGKPFRAMLFGLSTKPAQCTVPAYSRTFSISFKLIAAEFILKQTIRHLRDSFEYLPESSDWYRCLTSPTLGEFVSAAEGFIIEQINKQIDDKKLLLSREIYHSNGTVTINGLAGALSWKSRQINRYFQEYFGLPLKTYCSILRFRASFGQLNNGQLFPENNYYDQPHFIREVNKFSGTSPKRLAVNKDDRFIQLSTLASD